MASDAALEGWLADVSEAKDRRDRSLLHLEIGHAFEARGENDKALSHFRAALTEDAELRPALDAARRLAEQLGDRELLAETALLELKAAKTPHEEAAALISQALEVSDDPGTASRARALLERAHSKNPTPTSARFLELHYWRSGESAGLTRLLEDRAQRAADPVLRQLLQLELAELQASAGDARTAVRGLEEAASMPAERWRLLSAAKRLARRTAGDGPQETSDEVRFIELLADHAAGIARGEKSPGATSATTLPPLASEATAKRTASAFYWEASLVRRLRAKEGPSGATDRVAALASLDRAIELRPRDPFLRLERAQLLRDQGELDSAEQELSAASKLLPGGEHELLLHLERAELAHARGDAGDERAALGAALKLNPRSPVVAARLDALGAALGRPAMQVQTLCDRAAGLLASADDKNRERYHDAASECLWEAAQLMADELGDYPRAEALYSRAAAIASEPAAIVRELHGAALRLAPEAAAEVAARLLEVSGDPVERAALQFEIYRSGDRGREIGALLESEAPFWAPEIARLDAAASGDRSLLVRAHSMLAGLALAEEKEAAHRVAAARAALGHEPRAHTSQRLDDVLEGLPAHRYAVILQEELYRAAHREVDAARLLLRAAGSEPDSRIGEIYRLRAATLADIGGDPDLAGQALRAAAEATQSVAALWLLWRSALARGDEEEAQRALTILAASDSTSRADTVLRHGLGVFARLRLAESRALDDGHPSRAVHDLRGLSDAPTVGFAAAAWLAILPDPVGRTEALDRLLGKPRGRGEVALRQCLLQDLLREGGQASAVSLIARELVDNDPVDRASHLGRLELSLGRGDDWQSRRDSLLGLGRAGRGTPALLFAALVVEECHGEGRRSARILEELEEADSDGTALSVALDICWTVDIPAPRRIQSSLAQAEESSRPELEAALGRALLLSGHPGDAVRMLERAVDHDGEDIASWLSLRHAARAERRSSLLVRACDRLAEEAPDSASRAGFLEEAASALLEQLDKPRAAEERFELALRADPNRSYAFQQLHSLLSRRGDTEALLAIIGTRIQTIDEPSELVSLFYEQATLQARLQRPEEAVESLRSLQLLQPDHGPALALQAHLLTYLERWEEAVHSLREVAAVDLPAAERKGARWVAARFLAEHLDRPGEALEELSVVERMGGADEPLLAHIALLAERAGRPEQAVDALVKVAQLTAGSARARYERRAGALQAAVLDDKAAARESLRRALLAAQTDLSAAEALAALEGKSGRRRLAATFQSAVWSELQERPTDPSALRKLVRAGVWSEDADLQLLALDVLATTGQASSSELERLEDLAASAPTRPTGTLSDSSIGAIDGRLAGHPVLGIAAAARDALLAVEGRDAKSLGATSGWWGGKEPGKAEPHVRRWVEAVGGEVDKVVGYPAQADQGVAWLAPGSWAVRTGLPTDLPVELRGAVATMAVMARHDAAPLAGATREVAIDVLHAVCAASEAPIRTARPSAGERVDPLRRSLSRAAKRAVAKAAGTVSAEDVDQFAEELFKASWRARMIGSGELAQVLQETLGREEARFPEVLESGTGLEMIRFWLSPAHRELRQELALDVPNGEAASADPEDLERASAFFSVVTSDLRWELGTEEVMKRVLAEAGPRHADPPSIERRALPVDSVSGREAELKSFLEAASNPRRKATLLLALSELTESTGARGESLSILEQAHQHQPDHSLVRRRLRRAKAKAGDRKDAVRLLDGEVEHRRQPAEKELLTLASSLICLETFKDRRRATERAAEAADGSSGVGALLTWLLEREKRDMERDGALSERAAQKVADLELSAIILAESGFASLAAGDSPRARFLFRKAGEQDGRCGSARLGLARAAISEARWEEVVEAAEQLAHLAATAPAKDALLRVAARCAQRAGKIEQGERLLRAASHPPGAEAAMELAARMGDDARRRDSLVRYAEVHGRTERALALTALASSAEPRDAMVHLREASQADPTLALVRVAQSEAVRRLLPKTRGTSRELRAFSRTVRSEGLGPLAVAARCLALGDLDGERRALAEAADTDGDGVQDALELAIDATAGLEERTQLFRRRVDEALTRPLPEGAPIRVDALLALADLERGRGNQRAAAATLRRALEHAPFDTLASRFLASVTRAKERRATLWIDESRGTTGGRAAFASCQAARLLGTAEEAAASAVMQALKDAPDYLPALWLVESRARQAGDTEAVEATLLRRAELSKRSYERATLLVRAALQHEPTELTWLEQAAIAVPEDIGLAELRFRRSIGRLTDAERTALLGVIELGAPAEWRRVLALRRAAVHLKNDDPRALAAAILPLAVEDDAIALRLCERESLEVSAAKDTGDDLACALRLERIAQNALARGDDQTAAEALEGVLERFPGHLASLRALSAPTARIGDSAALASLEERFAKATHPSEASAHLRVGLRSRRRAHPAQPEMLRPAEDALVSVFDYAEVNLWMSHEVARIATDRGDRKLLSRALSEIADRLEGPPKVAVELRVAELLASLRSPGIAANHLARLGEVARLHPTLDEHIAELRHQSGAAPKAVEAFVRASQRAASSKRKSALLLRGADVAAKDLLDADRANELRLQAAIADSTNASLVDGVCREDWLSDADRGALLQAIDSEPKLEAETEPRLLAARAALEEALGKHDDAQLSLRRRAQLAPSAIAYSDLARALARSSDWKGSAAALERCVDALTDGDDEKHGVLLELSNAWERAENLRKAEAAAAAASRLAPNDPATTKRLADLRRMRGD